MTGRIVAALIGLWAGVHLLGPATYGQVADTTAAPDTTVSVVPPPETSAADATVSADTTGISETTAAVDAIAARTAQTSLAPVVFDPIWRGRPVTDSIPALLPALDLVDVIDRQAPSFTYRFATPGWPDGWSLQGLPPHAAGLTFNDLPFSHLFTGRPAYELVPLAMIEPPQLTREQYGHPAAILTNIRPYATPEPATEGRFWQGGDGLQSIEAVHAQHRRRSLFGNPGFLNVLGAYSGRAADGEYPGSRLRRARQVLLRARYEQRDWSLEIFNLHNRRSIGAHGGVVPNPEDIFESIYIRQGATVVNSEARRRIVRNDLAATLRLRILEDASTVSLFWTAESFHYSTPGDTVGTRSNRLGAAFAQPLLRSARHELSITAAAWRDGASPRYGFQRGDLSRGYVRASIQEHIIADGWHSILQGGIGAFSGGIHPVGSATFGIRLGAVYLTADASLSNRPAPAVSSAGFGSLSGLSDTKPGPIAAGTLALAMKGGAFNIELGGFANRRFEPVDYFEVSADSAAVLATGSAFDAYGAYARLEWRRDAARGLYAVAKPAVFQFSGDGLLNRRIADAHPELSGSARLGARFVLFGGDLDIDAYAEAIGWGRMQSRTMHSETGLLIVRESGRDVGPSSMVNIAVSAGVREATLFLVYENVLAGTTIMTGNLIVPVYPLPDRRFRFGVFWPIFG